MRDALVVVFISFIQFNICAQHLPVTGGVVDLREHDFSSNGSVALDGEWEFFMSELIPPEKFETKPDKPGDLITFPQTWNELSGSRQPGEGFATYHVRILIKPQTYSLDIPHFYSSYALWVNQSLIASNGTVGTTETDSKPQWRPQTVSFIATDDTLDLVIHASNFHHAKGGVREKLLIGLSNDLNFKRTISISSNVILCGLLALLGIGFVLVFLFLRNEGSALFFAALCISWALREAFSNVYVVTYYYPDFPWEITVKLEYISLYLTMIWAAFLVSSVFPMDVNPVFKYLFVACNVIFGIFTTFTTAALYTQFLPVYLSFSAILLLYVTYVLIHAVLRDRKGVWLIVGSILVGVIVFAYDLSSYQGLTTYNSLIVNAGYMGMFCLMALCLSLQFGFLKKGTRNRDMLTYEDLYGSGRK